MEIGRWTAHHNNKNELEVNCLQWTEYHRIWPSWGDQEAGSNGSVLGKLWATDEQDVLALGGY